MKTLAGVDLNLLVSLDTLLRVRSVTRASEEMGLSQPAMSAALARLRELLRDPLLVRGPRGMVPTARALELQAPLSEILAQISVTLHPPPPFDPLTSRRSFTLCTADYGELLVLPSLMERLATSAPGIDMVVNPSSEVSPWELLAEGSLDLSLGIETRTPAGMYRVSLFREHFVCLVRAGHPRAGGPLSLEEYVSLPHLLISPRGGATGTVDPILSELGLRRRIALRVPHFLVAPQVVARSDLILTLPARVAHALASSLQLTCLQPPLELPEFSLSLFWHERNHRDPAHSFLRNQIVDVCRAV